MVAIRCSVDASAGRCAPAWLNPCRHSPVRVFSSTCLPSYLRHWYAPIVPPPGKPVVRGPDAHRRQPPDGSEITARRARGMPRGLQVQRLPASPEAIVAVRGCRMPSADLVPGPPTACGARGPRWPPPACRRFRRGLPGCAPGAAPLSVAAVSPPARFPAHAVVRGSRWPPPASRRFRRGLPGCAPGAAPLSVAAVSPPARFPAHAVPAAPDGCRPPAAGSVAGSPAAPPGLHPCPLRRSARRGLRGSGGGTVFHHGGCGLGRLSRTDRATWRRRAATRRRGRYNWVCSSCTGQEHFQEQL